MRHGRTPKGVVVLVCVCAAAVTLGIAPGVSAAPRASVSLTLPHQVNENAPIPFSWTGSHLGRNHKLVIQRPFGTAHTWRSIKRLSTNSGSGELAGFPMGTYRLPIADFVGRRLLAQQVVGIGVFGQVPFSTLFSAPTSVYTTPTSSFPYMAGGEIGDDDPILKVERNRCNFVHVAFVPGPHGEVGTGSVTLVQESRDPVSASAPFDAIGSLDAQVVPGQSWAVLAPKASVEFGFIYVNGYAICSKSS
jgi:hypothetical protein